MDQTSIRRRNRLKHHYTMTSNVLIFGYADLDDSAKLTYQAIDSFDWPDQTGERKGYAYPSVRTVAKLRGVNERTIQRHFEALEKAGLLRREYQPGKPCLLWIEEPSREEAENYLSTIGGVGGDTDVTTTGDTDVTPNKKQEREKDKSVNGSLRLGEDRGRGGERLTELERAKREWLANHMVEQLGDPHSLGFYRKIASQLPEHQVFQMLSEVRSMANGGRIRSSRARLFTTLAKRPADVIDNSV